MDTAFKTYSIDVPSADSAFFNEFVGKMGWFFTETVKSPCQMSENELRYEVLESVKDARTGLGISLAQARKKHPII
jgi:hypothetical protein